MATYRAISVIGETLVGILTDSRPPDFPLASVELYQAANFRDPMAEGVSLYLFRVVPSASRRNLPPRVGPDGTRFRPSITFDLHYLLTPWGRSATNQHWLLGWMIRTLEDYSPLGAGLLNYYSGGEDTFDPGESHDLVFDVISIQDMSSIWELGKPAVQTSVTMMVRQVTLDSTRPHPDAGPMQIRDFRIGSPAGASS